jgi:hypothetical protein
MNTPPEAVKARHDAQQEMLSVIEAMMDGDAHDAQTHLVRWRDRNRYALQLERQEATTNAVSPEAIEDLRDLDRTLERELHESRNAERLARVQLATEREKSAALRLACERLRDCDWVISLPDRMDAVRDIAREALAATQAAP